MWLLSLRQPASTPLTSSRVSAVTLVPRLDGPQVCEPILHINHLRLLLAMRAAECVRGLEEVGPSELSALSPRKTPVKMPCQHSTILTHAHWDAIRACLPQCVDQGAG